MGVKVTWYSHACVLIEVDGTRLLVDPFLTGNPLAPVTADQVAADFVFVSHGHGDHVGDTVKIAQRTGATVVSNFEIYNWLAAQGLTKLHPQHIGGGFHGRPVRLAAHHDCDPSPRCFHHASFR